MTDQTCRNCAHARWDMKPSGRYGEFGRCVYKPEPFNMPECWNKAKGMIWALYEFNAACNAGCQIFRSNPHRHCPCWKPHV